MTKVLSHIEKQIRQTGGLSVPDHRLPPLNTKTAKMHKMVSLLQTHSEGLGIQHLSSLLGVDERTVKRYLSDLKRLKFDLVSKRIGGRKSLYHIQRGPGTPEHYLPALKKIRGELNAGGNPKYSGIISQLIHYLEAKDAPVGSPNKSETLPPATDAYFIDHGPFAEADPAQGILKILETAIAMRSAVRIAYSGYSSGTGEHIFFPYTLSLRVGTLYLIGQQAENPGIFKSLSVKRIKRCIATQQGFKREAFDPAEFYKYCFGQWARQLNENPVTVVLVLRAGWLEKFLSESHFHPPGKIVRQGKDVCFEVKIVIKPDFVNWILSLVPDLIPLKPESLRQEVAARLKEGMQNLSL